MHSLCVKISLSKFGTYKTAKARFWPWLSGSIPYETFKVFPFRSNGDLCVAERSCAIFSEWDRISSKAAKSERGRTREEAKSWIFLKAKAKIWPTSEIWP